jgi:hypothetical protein
VEELNLKIKRHSVMNHLDRYITLLNDTDTVLAIQIWTADILLQNRLKEVVIFNKVSFQEIQTIILICKNNVEYEKYAVSYYSTFYVYVKFLHVKFSCFTSMLNLVVWHLC